MNPQARVQAPAYAGLITRLIALMIDATILTIAVAVINLVGQTFLSFVSLDLNRCHHPSGLLLLQSYACHAVEFLGPATLLLLPPFYQVLFWVAAGQTPGMAICGIRIAPSKGESLSLWSACVRFAGNWISTAAFGLGFFAMLWESKRRTWADKLAGTTVVYSSRAVLARTSIIATCALSIFAGCGGSKNAIERHPSIAIYDRNVSRIERIELIIDDPNRAARVKECYIEIEQLMQKFSRDLHSIQTPLLQKDWDDSVTDEQVHQLFALQRQKRRDAEQRYVQLQLEIRKLTTADEFRKIDKLR